MNQELNKVEETIKREEEVRRFMKERSQSNKDFSYPNFFAGDEFNQELDKLKTRFAEFKINIIDLGQSMNQKGEWMEKIIKQICNDLENKKLVEDKKLPIIWFKNINQSNADIQKALLSIFDPGQNAAPEFKLDDYHLIATSSTHDMNRIPEALISRLNCVNVTTAQPPKSFFDKHFNLLLGSTVFFIMILLVYLFWPNKAKEFEK